MSPKNLQETLQKQQEAIKAHVDYRLLQSKNSQVLKHKNTTFRKPQGSPRNIFTHQGKRKKIGVTHKQSLIHDVNLSSKGFSVETSQAISKRNISSIDGYNSTGVIGSPENNSQLPSGALNQQFTMGVEGKSILTNQGKFHVGSLLQNDDLEAVSN